MGALKHGHTRAGMVTSEYHAWVDMIQRCYNPKNKRYASYGGRGIWVCARWRTAFGNFLLDMGPKPAHGFSLERLDNDAGYRPENCKWGSSWEQSHNRRDCKLNWEKVAEIREVCAAASPSELPHLRIELAKKFGVHKVMIGNVIRGRCWKPDLHWPPLI